MNIHHDTPSSTSTIPEVVAAQAAVQPGAQGTTEQAGRKTTRPWFKKKRIVLPIALLAVIATVLVVNSRNDPTTLSTPPQAQSVAPHIGSKVSDGTFEFVVTGVEHPGKTMTGKVGSTLTAKGEFVIVRVDVTNNGKAAKRLDSSCQFLVNGSGQQLAPSPAILSTKDALKFVQWLNPGDTVKNTLVLFDVAPGTEALNVDLHQSPSSAGVMVKLS